MNQSAAIKHSPANLDKIVNRNTVNTYAAKWSARLVVASSTDEHLAVVMHDDHVFAAASSRVSPEDAIARLAARIRAKSA